MARIPVIIDCDPGHDDTIAILLACVSDELDVRAITVVAGNQTLPKVLNNCLRVVSYAGIQGVPVAGGCEAPLLRPLVTAGHVHGETGLDGAEIPPPRFAAHPMHAVELMAAVLRESTEPVTLVPTAPQTNVAMLLSLYPELKSKIREIVFMGGATTLGNVTPSAEFNAYVDPEALRVVLRSGVPITQIGLDVTHQVLVTPARMARIRAIGGRVSTMVADLMEFYFARGRERHQEGSPLHDPVAVAQVIRPGLVSTRPYFVDVECHGELTAGRTVVDVWGVRGHPPNVNVGESIRAEEFFDMVFAALERYP